MKDLFNNLMALCSEPDSAFSFKDFERAEQRFRIFNYRLASYTDFMKPDAREARGIMFLMDNKAENNPIKIACRPPEKFFNWGENPMTMDLDLNEVVEWMVKEDGSLISSYIYGSHGYHNLGLKSKGALFSDQAQWAEQWLHHPDNTNFRLAVHNLTIKGWTVNMEFVSPRNQIVLSYPREKLVVLNIRNNENGMTLFKDQVEDKHLEWVKAEKNLDMAAIPVMQGIEGFVLRFTDGQLVKIKTDAYLVLHKAKDSVTIPRHLFEAVILEASDDLRLLFREDPLSLKKISDMEDMVRPRYNHMIASVEKFHKDNKDLVRKDYAIKGQKEIAEFFGLAMNKYLGREMPYKEFAIKNYKIFGVPDVEVVTE